MGAEPYQYLVDYEDDIGAVLKKLRERVFESGEFNGAQFNPSTPEEALEMAAEDGTRSILDIMAISETPQFCAAAPLTAEELHEFFGTDKPTVKMFEENMEFWESLERGMARYIIIYEGDVPTQIFFVGYSFD
jgi:hypothetical protein